MTTRMTRRTACWTLGAVGLGALVQSVVAADARDEAPEQAAATFLGSWTYRSFLSNPNIKVDFDKLEFARATLIIEKAPFGVLRGKLTFGDDFLTLKGSLS